MITIPSHHNGPTGLANGGVAAGRFAELIDPRQATVRFLAPTPVATRLDHRVGGSDADTAEPDGFQILVGDRPIATVHPATGSSTADALDTRFQRFPDEVVAAASAADHPAWGPSNPFPTCFGCGPQRQDGLALRSRAVPGTDVNACNWTPDPGLDAVPEWMVWAALDCASGAPAMSMVWPDHIVVTGELSVSILGDFRPGESYQILSRVSRQSGRRLFVEAAALDGAGLEMAIARSTWVSVEPSFLDPSSLERAT